MHNLPNAALSPEEQKKKAAQDRLAQSEYTLAEEMVKEDGSIERQHLTNASVTELQNFYGEKLKKYAVDNAQEPELQSFARQWSYNINADNVSWVPSRADGNGLPRQLAVCCICASRRANVELCSFCR